MSLDNLVTRSKTPPSDISYFGKYTSDRALENCGKGGAKQTSIFFF